MTVFSAPFSAVAISAVQAQRHVQARALYERGYRGTPRYPGTSPAIQRRPRRPSIRAQSISVARWTSSMRRAYRYFETLRYFACDRPAHLRLKCADGCTGLGAEDAIRRAGVVAEGRQITLDSGDPLAGESWV